MTIYQLLDIDENASKKEIKRAYARKVKQMDLSKDVDEYQALRQAYDLALSLHDNQEMLPEVKVNQDDVMAEEPIEGFDSELDLETVDYQESFDDKMSELIRQESYFDDGSLWESLLRPYLNESLQQYEDIRQRMIYFIVENVYLLSDKVRKKIISLCEITDEDWVSYYGYYDYSDLLADNHLRFKDYEAIPIGQRETYYHHRYQIYRFLFEDQPEGASVNSIVKEAMAFSYLDDDLLYLLVLYHLGQSKEQITQSRTVILNLLARIRGNRYRFDSERLATLTQFLSGEEAAKLSYVEIQKLEWTPERLKRYWVSLLYPKKKIPEKREASLGQRRPKWHSIWGVLMILILILKVGRTVVNRADTPPRLSYQESQIEAKNWEIDGVKVSRSFKPNPKIQFLADLFAVDEEEPTDSQWRNEFSDEGYERYLTFKETNKDQVEQIKQRGINYQKVFHSFQDQGTVVRVFFLRESDGMLEVNLNWEGQIVSIALQPENQESKLFRPGSYLAYDYFREDLNEYHDVDNYLNALNELGKLYMTEELRDEVALKLTSSAELRELKEFINLPGAVLGLEPTVLGLKKDEAFLFIEFNEHEQLSDIYGGVFNEPPQDFLDKAGKATFDSPL